MTPPDAGATRFGTIALAGKPNAGKSTLLNALVGEELAITSPRPQTTRLPVMGLRTEADVQLLFVDPPGLLDPTYLLQRAMLQDALRVLQHADGILYLVPEGDPDVPSLAALVPGAVPTGTPQLLLRTKADLSPGRTASGTAAHLVVSARTGAGIPEVLAWCAGRARPGPFRYDPDDLSTQPTRFFVSEFVREAAFDFLGEELPYALATDVDEFREGSSPLYIRVTLYVERDSQKGMVVGQGGRMLKRIGTQARGRIEAFLQQPVYLDLWVKTLPKWRSQPDALRRLGFQPPPEKAP
ncbi:MAG TPA: GTPase Era [Gemmatimonadales bacterium]|jgi:GTP-binding protein Era